MGAPPDCLLGGGTTNDEIGSTLSNICSRRITKSSTPLVINDRPSSTSKTGGKAGSHSLTYTSTRLGSESPSLNNGPSRLCRVTASLRLNKDRGQHQTSPPRHTVIGRWLPPKRSTSSNGARYDHDQGVRPTCRQYRHNAGKNMLRSPLSLARIPIALLDQSVVQVCSCADVQSGGIHFGVCVCGRQWCGPPRLKQNSG